MKMNGPARPSKRIALVHALAHSPAPVQAEFRRQWPECRLMNLLDDSLSADLSAAGGLDDAMIRRFETVVEYVVASGSDTLLFTCSAHGPYYVDLARRPLRVPRATP